LKKALDPAQFAIDILGMTPDPWQADVLRWTGKRLILNCSRQTGKSTIASILALHRALYYPGSLILLISPSMRQSSELFRKVSDFLQMGAKKPQLIEDNKLSFALENGSRVISLPSSEPTVRGFSGASLIIEDEASRVDDALYFAIRPMLAVTGGRIILMSTPFGKRGHFYDEWFNGGWSWERICIRAEDCARISREFLEEERNSLGEWWYRQEYCCEFMDTTDQIFLSEHVQKALSDEIKPLFT
jgi:hypothetical protein